MSNKSNIFCASNPARLLDALWSVLGNRDFSHDIIFLPSRRAIRSVEKMLAEKSGGTVLLPKLVALGEEPDEEENQNSEFINHKSIVSNLERTLVLAKMFSEIMGGGLGAALPVAKDFVRMSDYMENEGASLHDSLALLDFEYAGHYQEKAKFFTAALQHLPAIFSGRKTEAQKRNEGIREWLNHKSEFINQKSKIIVCGSTASVPATADLMEFVAGLDNGFIILPGKINTANDFLLETNPYHSEYKFLQRIGVAPEAVEIIDTGESPVDFYNAVFSNSVAQGGAAFYESSLVKGGLRRSPPHRIDCARESEESEVVAEIAARAVAENKTVLVITPDAAGNQRIAESFRARGLDADFSGGISGAQTLFGRRLLNEIEKIRNQKSEIINLFEFVENSVIAGRTKCEPATPEGKLSASRFAYGGCGSSLRDARNDISEADLPLIEKLKEVSDILQNNGIVLGTADARAVAADALSSVQIRPLMKDDCKISVLGTIESRMQSADIIILTGLNEGMFPAIGYENPWLPRRVANAAGLPPPERKVSLMALDFINLSCGGEVYWLRSKTAGGSETTESRFLSRIAVKNKSTINNQQSEILESVRANDEVPFSPLDYSAPTPPAVRDAVFVTELELLIHNPYAFYARHILRLYPKDDPWNPPGAKEFGNLVHEAIEAAEPRQAFSLGSGAKNENTAGSLIELLDQKAKAVLIEKDLSPDGVLFRFWHKRFLEIAPAALEMLNATAGGTAEIAMETTIAGRTVKARADRVYENTVIDIKTGAAPSKKQLEEGNMPQLPLEAFMLHNGIVGANDNSPQIPENDSSRAICNSPLLHRSVVIQFLQLRNNAVRLIEYSGPQAQKMIDAAVAKTEQLFGQYGKDGAAYNYHETSDEKYKAYDDLARVRDLS